MMAKKYQKYMKTIFETSTMREIERLVHFFGDNQTIQKSKTPALHWASTQKLHHDFNTANVYISSATVERRRDDFKKTPIDPSKIILTKHQLHFL